MLQYLFSVKNEGPRKVFRIMGIKIKPSRYRFQRVKAFSNDKPTLAFQMNLREPGQAEERLFLLAASDSVREKYNVVIITEGSRRGCLADRAREKAIPVYSWFFSPKCLVKLIRKLNISVVHMLDNLSGIEKYRQYGVKRFCTIHDHSLQPNNANHESQERQYQYVNRFAAVSIHAKEDFCGKFRVSKAKVGIIANEKEDYESAYLNEYAQLCKVIKLADVEAFLADKSSYLSIFAPYPDNIKEGWMSRISAVDRVVEQLPRLYINTFYWEKDIRILKHGPAVYELSINNTHPEFADVVKLVHDATKLFYCHTLRLAEYLLPVLKHRKCIVDIHGVTPEEEVMQGRPEMEGKFAQIEQEVLRYARYCVMPTDAMKVHYANKYPTIKPANVITLPIVENLDIDETCLSKVDVERDHIIYSGGIHAWQNLGAMLELAKNAPSLSFTFLSNSWQQIVKQCEEQGITNVTSMLVSKQELKAIYNEVQMGLLLRDDSPVNFVACPTKLYEYMVCGIIPIVKTPHIGDFEQLGYMYIRQEEVANGHLPGKEKRKEIILNNFEVAGKLQQKFRDGSASLLREITQEVR